VPSRKLDLAARHAHFDLVDLGVVEQVALLDIDAIDARRDAEAEEAHDHRAYGKNEA